MTTNDVFSNAVKTMATFGDMPWGGEVYKFDVWSRETTIMLDDDAQPAQALLAWMYLLDDREIRHHHSDGHTFVSVKGTLAGIQWDVWSSFDGEDATLLCEHTHDRGPILLHRLRQVQMRQTAALVGAE